MSICAARVWVWFALFGLGERVGYVGGTGCGVGMGVPNGVGGGGCCVRRRGTPASGASDGKVGAYSSP
eukprot:scaffold14778_cov109-Isochrysis_galbana.AAC.2